MLSSSPYSLFLSLHVSSSLLQASRDCYKYFRICPSSLKAQAPRRGEANVLGKQEKMGLLSSPQERCPRLGDPGGGGGQMGKLEHPKAARPRPLKASPLLETTVWNICDFRSGRNNLIQSDSVPYDSLGVEEPQAGWRLSFLQPHRMRVQGRK